MKRPGYYLGPKEYYKTFVLNETFQKLLVSRILDGSLKIEIDGFGMPNLLISTEIKYIGSPYR